jgi:exodeoxyribonuclease VII small subunit
MMTYNQIYQELTMLLTEIEDDAIQLESLSEKVIKANNLITLCENKLRNLESDMQKALIQEGE